MSDRIGEQILVESYKVLYDYIAMNESEDAKFELQIKTYQKIEDTIKNEAKSKSDIFKKMLSNREKLEDPIVVFKSMDMMYSFYRDNENDALELMKMISSNDTDGIKDGGYVGNGRSKGSYLAETVNELGALALNLYREIVIDEDRDRDTYKKFILKAFPVWVKSARRLLSAANKYSK